MQMPGNRHVEGCSDRESLRRRQMIVRLNQGRLVLTVVHLYSIFDFGWV
jgi:hypothetical protein